MVNVSTSLDKRGLGLPPDHRQQAVSQPWDVVALSDGPISDTWNREVTRTQGHEISQANHFVQFYETDAFLLDVVTKFIGSGIRSGDTAVVIATEAHREGLEQRLEQAKFDLEEARAQGRYIAIDATSTAVALVAEGAFDAERFEEFISEIVGTAEAQGRQVRFYGELAPILISHGNHVAAICVEHLINQLQNQYPFLLLCAYQLDTLGAESFVDLHAAVCSTHSQVYPSESYVALSTMDERMRAVAVLQQKSRWLETEIANRKLAEARITAALEAERTAGQEAVAALRVRDDFLAIAAHDLKSPLATLSAQAQHSLRRLQRDGALGPQECKKALETITAQTATLDRLINNILSDSSLGRGSLAIAPKLVDLAPLVARVVEDGRMRSGRHQIDLESPLSCDAVVDQLRIEQVLVNLLDNAIRYSSESLPIKVVLSRPSEGVAELTVRDFGPGVPPEQRPYLFERYFQGNAGGDGRRGMGLGLYICRQIVALHGGEIRAELPEEGGTRIIVLLPLGLNSLSDADSDG